MEEDWIVITSYGDGQYYVVELQATSRSNALEKAAKMTVCPVIGGFPRRWAEAGGWHQMANRPEFDVRTNEMLDAWGDGETAPNGVVASAPAQANKQPPRDRWWDLPAPNAPGFADQCWAAVEAIGKGT